MLTSLPEPSAALVIGASRGIGLALAERLLESSKIDQVVVAARTAASADRLGQLQQEHAKRLLRLTMDVTDQASVADAAARLKESGIRPRLVMNVAGVLHERSLDVQPEKRLEDIDAHSMESVFRVNTIGPALSLRYFLPLVPRDGRAVFAVLSARVGSISDNRLGGWYAYRASKAALNQIVKTASIEARRRFPEAIIAALHPGTTDTALSDPFQSNVPEDKLFSPAFVAGRLLAVVDGLETSNSGGFFAWDGQTIPW
jgi:NAD(P)-dependent dehydrogenase (short-subunit alcohol dehydrogenase family)